MNGGRRSDWTHLQHVLHLDDAALLDGRPHRRDLDGPTVPRLPGSGAHHVAAQRGHHRPLLLHRAARNERLRLGDEGFGHNGPGCGVVELGKHRYDLTCSGGAGLVRTCSRLQVARRYIYGGFSYLECNLCGQSLRLRTPVQSYGTTSVPACPSSPPEEPEDKHKPVRTSLKIHEDPYLKQRCANIHNLDRVSMIMCSIHNGRSIQSNSILYIIFIISNITF